ncbi:polymorphic toxin-type HINT domain-containing protein, partial [Actinobacillus porcinus]|uniref:polymorphic toxin-type HINT domain-containing protein n=1 Tax=Actinobacillus porcinus TaxID=51048 RepID=UPI002A90A486
NGKVINNPTRAQYADKSLKREKGDIGLTGGIGIPLHESQSDSSLTKATLTEGNITLNKDSQPTQTTAKALGINTELKNANKQVENTLNLDRTLQEQKAVQAAVANLQEATTTYIDNKRKEAQAEFDKVKQQYDQNSEAYKTAEAAVKAWEIGGKNKQNIDTVTAVVSTVLAGSPASQIAVAALSPTLNNQIHVLTKEDDSKLTNILAHAVLGAIEAKAAGVNGASGAVAAAGAEIIAHTLAEQLYGVDGKTKKMDDLTQEEKQNILALSQIGSAIAGGMTADSGYAAGVSGEIGKRAVEHNDFYDVPMGAMTDFEMVENIAKIYFDGDEEKATKFLMAFRKAEGEGIIDNVIGSVKSLIHINETIKSIGYVIAHPNETIENIKLSAEEWHNLLSYAMKNDPTLAGEMLGYIKGSATAIPGTDLVLGGAIAKTAQKVIKLAKQSGAAFTNKIDDVANLGVNNPKYDKALNEKITEKGNVTVVEKKAQTDTTHVCNSIACFVAGTLIETARGLIPIEQIGFGDLIWSREEFGNHYAYKPVTATKATDNQQLVEVIVENEQGQQETYLTTKEHPFYVEGIGWLKASLLIFGMKLLDRNGSASLTVVSQNALERYATVYNIMVDDHHTYHIGELGVWVHNANCCDFTKQYGDLTKKWDGKWVDKNGEVIYLDPLDGKIKPFPDGVKPSVDHILPRNYIENINGFNQLPKDIQEKLLNHPNNLQPMPKHLNSSKGNKVEFVNGGWMTVTQDGKKVPINTNYKIFLESNQKLMSEMILKEVNNYNGAKK